MTDLGEVDLIGAYNVVMLLTDLLGEDCPEGIFWEKRAILEKYEDAVVAAEREACAKLIRDNQETQVNGAGKSTKFVLAPRLAGNLTGLSFADAIMARGVQ